MRLWFSMVLIAIPAAAQPTHRVTATTRVGQVVIGPSGDAHWLPAIAWDGASWVVAWADARGTFGITGARVSPDCTTLLDPTGFRVMETGDSSWPRLACSPGLCLAHDMAVPGQLARVSSGVVLDQPPLTVVTSGLMTPTDVAWTGGEFVWTHHTTAGLRFGRTTLAGVVSVSGVISNSSNGSTVACAPPSCLLVDQELHVPLDGTNDVRSRRFLADGGFVDTAPRQVGAAAGGFSRLQLTAVGQTYVMTYNNPAGGVVAAAVPVATGVPTTAVLRSGATPASIHAATPWGSGALVTFRALSGPATRVSAAFVTPALAISPLPLDFDADLVQLASSPTQAAAVYALNSQIYVRAITDAGQAGPALQVSQSAARQVLLNLGRPSGGEPVVVWSEFPAADSVRAAVLHPDGGAGVIYTDTTVFEPQPTLTGLPCSSQLCLALTDTADGGEALARISTAGQVLGQLPLPVLPALATALGESGIAWDGTTFVVTRPTDLGLVVNRLDPAGNFVGGGAQVPFPNPGSAFPPVSGNGQVLVISETDLMNAGPDDAGQSPATIVLLRSDGGVVTNPWYVMAHPNWTAQVAVGLASGGFVIAADWEDFFGVPGPDYEMHIRRVTRDGIGVPTTVVALPSVSSPHPLLATDGTAFGLVWTDSPDGGARRTYFREFLEDATPIGPVLDLGLMPAGLSLYPPGEWRLANAGPSTYVMVGTGRDEVATTKRLDIRWILPLDAGFTPVPDAGPVDAGAGDAGSATDAGEVADAGSDVDAGTARPDAGEPASGQYVVRCACAAGVIEPLLGALLLVAVRRRRRPSSSVRPAVLSAGARALRRP